jgi:hypothetical protein
MLCDRGIVITTHHCRGSLVSSVVMAADDRHFPVTTPSLMCWTPTGCRAARSADPLNRSCLKGDAMRRRFDGLNSCKASS